MLKLIKIRKNYTLEKSPSVRALNEVTLQFDKNGFVGILGPSGCGKTTLLNIIGGLDQYSSGDLIIDDVSTKKFTSKDWDNYRNKRVGIVFQSYNLIPHLSIQANVELSMTLAGISKKIRQEKAIEALTQVGLKNQKDKKPNQLSGGQMQRVAIARAIVNNPNIILCDEPTGALDSKTSVVVMDLLSELSKTHLVIMVTHNETLAYDYCTRIIQLKDGEVVSDKPNKKSVQEKEIDTDLNLTNEINSLNLTQVDANIIPSKEKKEKSRMNFGTALSISGKNLLTKKGRTAMVSIAGSFGIIGVSLVLALQNGFTGYMSRMEKETLTSFPITIEKYALPDLTSVAQTPGNNLDKYPDDGSLHIGEPAHTTLRENKITNEYIAKVQDMENQGVRVGSVQLTYGLNTIVVTQNDNYGSGSLGEEASKYITIDTSSSGLLGSLTSSSYYHELPGDKEFVLDQYDVIAGRYPEKENELLITVDQYNRISRYTLEALGISTDSEKMTSLDSLLNGKEYKIYKNSDYYSNNASLFVKQGDETDEAAIQRLLKEHPDNYFPANGKLKRDADINEVLDLFMKANQGGDTSTLLQDFKKYFDVSLSEKNYLVPNYQAPGDSKLDELWADDSKLVTDEPLKVVGVLRQKENVTYSMLNSGVYYTPELTNLISGYTKENPTTGAVEHVNGVYEQERYDAMNNNIKVFGETRVGQSTPETQSVCNPGLYCPQASYVASDDVSDNVFLQLDRETMQPKVTIVSNISGSTTIDFESYMNLRTALGTDSGVSSITIYPEDFDSKQQILNYLDSLNEGKAEEDKVIYTDLAKTATDLVGNLVTVVSAVLIVFASISLVVSSVMIGIITYVSVIERKKEIGILRSIGARKKDVGTLFIAESTIVGLFAGLIGVIFSYLVEIPINLILNAIYPDVMLGMIANLSPLHAFLMIALSIFLTFVAGLIPSSIASKKNPVECLRSE